MLCALWPSPTITRKVSSPASVPTTSVWLRLSIWRATVDAVPISQRTTTSCWATDVERAKSRITCRAACSGSLGRSRKLRTYLARPRCVRTFCRSSSRMSRDTVACVTSQPRALRALTNSRCVATSSCCTTVWMRRWRSVLPNGARLFMPSASPVTRAGRDVAAAGTGPSVSCCIEYTKPVRSMQTPEGRAARRRPAMPAGQRRPPAAPRRPRSRRHLGAAAGVGEDLEQHRVLHAAVDDVGAGHAALQRLAHGRDLGDHAAGDAPRGLQRPEVGEVALGDGSDLAALVLVHALDVGEEDDLLGVERGGDLPGDRVGVDVVGLAVLVGADAGHDRDIGLGQQVEHADVDLGDLADEAEVDGVAGLVLMFLGRDLEQMAVLAGDADGRPAVAADEPDDLLVHLVD